MRIMILIIMSIIQYLHLLYIHTNNLFLLSTTPHPPPSPTPPPAIGFRQRVHHKQISQQIHVSFSREVIPLSLNFSCSLLLIGPLIYPHPISQKVHNFRQTGRFPRHVFITAACISSFIRS